MHPFAELGMRMCCSEQLKKNKVNVLEVKAVPGGFTYFHSPQMGDTGGFPSLNKCL